MSEERPKPKARKKPPPTPLRPKQARARSARRKGVQNRRIGYPSIRRNLDHKGLAIGSKKKDSAKET